MVTTETFAEFLLVYAFTTGPFLALAIAFVGSARIVYRLEEKWLLLLVLVPLFMAQHQILEAVEILTRGVVALDVFQESVETTANLLTAGSIYYVLSFAREKQRLADDLTESERRNERILENTYDGILVIDPGADEIIRANQRAADMLGYDHDKLVGMGPSDIHPHEMDQFRRFVEAVEAEGAYLTDSLSCKRRDGSEMPAEISASTIQLDSDNYVLAAVRDITEQQRRERRIQVLTRVLRHNYRNELNLIYGLADQLEREFADDVEGIATQIQILVSDMIEMADDIRQAQRILEQESDDTRSIDLRPILTEVVESLRESYPEAEIINQIDDNWQVKGTDHLTIVFRHLLENGIEHSEQETPRVEISVQEQPEEGGWVAIDITDNGPGIPDQERVVIDETRDISPLEHGSGIGLWVAKWVINEFTGSLELVESSTDGTTIRIRLPTPDEHTHDVRSASSSANPTT